MSAKHFTHAQFASFLLGMRPLKTCLYLSRYSSSVLQVLTDIGAMFCPSLTRSKLEGTCKDTAKSTVSPHGGFDTRAL